MHLRRLRQTESIRNLVRETNLHINHFILPLFIVEGENIKREIPSMPGVYHFSVDRLDSEIKSIQALGLEHVLLFGVVTQKDQLGSQAFNEHGVIQCAVRKIKSIAPGINVITDVCMCEYTSHGHCGILDENGNVNNGETLEYMARIARSHAQAGADMVAPSSMTDGVVKALRQSLNDGGFVHIPIMAYSVKYASGFYAPFREAAQSAPQFGDRRGYQMDCANSKEALREAKLDVLEGADILMVKPALPFLDIISIIKQNFNIPLAAYQVSGEYSMLKTAVKNGYLTQSCIDETLLAIKRAGADIIITYFAKELAQRLR